ncbi:MAG TPA: FAD-dependent oxidoreductase, partial [Candidatus Omnitrophota bacterium]|nr:FAD-dependent oxidoreductase [Candidatus Omnitrophota bacterium]
KFEEHMRKYEIALREDEEVLEIKKQGKIISLRTDKGTYEAKSIIIASGKRSRLLNVPGEMEFKNKGLTYCATCDAPLFPGKDAAVIGGGNSALDATIQLMRIARHIYLININKELGGDPIMQEQVENSELVTILNNTKVTAVTGDKFVKGIKVQEESQEKTLSVSGVFVEIGLMPNSEFAKELERNTYNEIKVNSRNETNIPGIFAAGDVTDVPEKQIIIAAGEGSKACLSAFRYLILNKF